MVVLPTRTKQHHSNRHANQNHHLTELVSRYEPEIIFLPFLHLLVYLLTDLLPLATLHCRQIPLVVLGIE